MILSICANRNWKVHSMDIKTAFLQGLFMSRDVYVRPPSEANCHGTIWKLNKCVYGLSDASLHWYKRVKEVMVQCGGVVSKVDPSVFYWLDKDGKVTGILACHVDDFIWGGTPVFQKEVITEIRSAFKVGKEDTEAFKYCGIELKCADRNISLDQHKYTESLMPIDVDSIHRMEKDNPLNEEEQHILRSKIGQLLWLAHQSRPDLLFDVTCVSTNIKHWTVKDMIAINKVITKAKLTKLSLKFQYIGDNKDTGLAVYSDASLGNLPDGGSQGGYLILLVNKETGIFCPIWWNSKKIRRVVRSTLAAETVSMTEGIDMAVFIATLYAELTYGEPNQQLVPITCITDCRSLVDAVNSQKFVAEKRLRIELSMIKELLENGQIKAFMWVDTKRQLADCLTKRGASTLALRAILQSGTL